MTEHEKLSIVTDKGLEWKEMYEAAQAQLCQIEACVENDDCPDLPLVTRVASVVANLQTMIGKWHEAKEERDALQETITACEKEVALVYCTLTNGKFSKMNTEAGHILSEIESGLSKLERENATLREFRDGIRELFPDELAKYREFVGSALREEEGK